jgi:hypothetical protein
MHDPRLLVRPSPPHPHECLFLACVRVCACVRACASTDYIQEQESSHDCPTRFMVLDDESFGQSACVCTAVSVGLLIGCTTSNR